MNSQCRPYLKPHKKVHAKFVKPDLYYQSVLRLQQHKMLPHSLKFRTKPLFSAVAQEGLTIIALSRAVTKLTLLFPAELTICPWLLKHYKICFQADLWA